MSHNSACCGSKPVVPYAYDSLLDDSKLHRAPHALAHVRLFVRNTVSSSSAAAGVLKVFVCYKAVYSTVTGLDTVIDPKNWT